jgi:diguanylate cyclase
MWRGREGPRLYEDISMAGAADEHERTMAFAGIALGQMKALRQPATPRNYEIWYNYATGYQPSLNQTINETLKHKGTLSDADLESIYETYLSPVRLSERIDTVGSQVKGEIEQVMAMIDAAAGSASSYTESLTDMSAKLGQSKDRESLRAIIESLVHTAKEMKASNQKLEERLNASKQEINELQTNLEVMRNETLTDPLTQLANRKFFDSAIEAAIIDARAKNEALSLMMTDVDHFKKFNDNFGHLTGDQVLRLVASAVKQNVKGRDIAARYGGEEFAIILPNTVLRSAITVADHIRRAVMTKELMKRSTGEHLGHVTISIGVATLHKTDSPQTLIERSDKCLYAAKRHGRNRVMCETDPEVTAGVAAAPQVA